jgi:hypothetical protein
MIAVIPGREQASEPGIHNPRREYGFPDAQLRIIACASGRLSPTEGTSTTRNCASENDEHHINHPERL